MWYQYQTLSFPWDPLSSYIVSCIYFLEFHYCLLCSYTVFPLLHLLHLSTFFTSLIFRNIIPHVGLYIAREREREREREKERGRRVIGFSWSLIWSQTLMELVFNPCGEFRWSPKSLVSHIQTPHLLVGDPEIFWDLLKSVQMLKTERDAESKGMLLHLFSPW